MQASHDEIEHKKHFDLGCVRTAFFEPECRNFVVDVVQMILGELNDQEDNSDHHRDDQEQRQQLLISNLGEVDRKRHGEAAANENSRIYGSQNNLHIFASEIEC